MSTLADKVVEIGTLAGVAGGGIAVESFAADIPLDMRLEGGADGPQIAASYPGLMRRGAFERPLGRLKITVDAQEDPS